MATTTCDATTEEVDADEARAEFEAQVRDALGIGRVDFLEALDRGDFDETDREDVVRLRMLAPFAR
ncbi:hypothetical protein [Jannaschia sp. R86511]|uniref:hypothetical protein n=1 Tax=Jannaschia sp. R86511 TaxID=3093853 RepID=UPI0036D2966A